MKSYFTDPETLASTLANVMCFQHKHRMFLNAQLTDLDEKCIKGKEEVKNLTKLIHEGNREFKRLNVEHYKMRYILTVGFNIDEADMESFISKTNDESFSSEGCKCPQDGTPPTAKCNDCVLNYILITPPPTPCASSTPCDNNKI
ncbi:uncharacterized protein LOC143911866 [Arctopsyche grandis]|uniref:uncharacterized protein LOC143911866 n=1 Tax=Arctopsyche grandis TaxID=121162 RepID=UPI00406D96DF